MSRSVKEQIKSGLRVGGSLAMFFIAMAPLIDGLRRVVWTAPRHHLAWSPIGWVELILAAGLLASTAKVWMQWLAGCMLFGLFKGVWFLIAGSSIPGPELAWAVIVFSVTLALMLSIALRETLLLIESP